MAAVALIPIPQSESTALLAHSFNRAEAYSRASKAPATRRGYQSDWRRFAAWCASAGLDSLPAQPETVAFYISHLAETHKPATVGRHLASIASAHKGRGFSSPASMQHGAVASVWQGIKRTHGTAQVQKQPLLTADMRAMVRTLSPDRLISTRDRALLLVGFAGAFRRSELVGLDVADCSFSNDGLTITLRRSKTDQEGAGRKVGIPYGSNPETCPVRGMQAWLAASGITEGPVFRWVNRHGGMQPGRLSGTAVALIVKRHAGAAGFDASKFAGHSLRAGLATQAAMGGASERSIMNTTGHKSSAMVRRYIRGVSLFTENAAAVCGL